MKFGDKFDHWVHSGPFTAADLGIYRILYALAALFTVPDISWLAQYPDFMFNAPPGPIMLWSGFPDPVVLTVLEVLRSAFLILLGLGVWTRYVSIGTWLLLTITYGLTFTLGKVDHTILMATVPLVLAFSGWGDRYSVDAVRRVRDTPPRQWTLRLLALLIGWAFFAAALTKLLTGWLSFDSQAARGYYVLAYVTENRTYLLADWVAAHDVRAVWEVVDWMTVLFELSILISLPWWRAFRVALAVATTFHLGVLLVMNIDFSNAVVAYGAFVSWSAVARPLADSRIGRAARRLGRRWTRAPARAVGWAAVGVLAVAIGAAAWSLMGTPAGRVATGSIAGHLVIVVGALIGVAYLVSELRRTVRRGSTVVTLSPPAYRLRLPPGSRAP